MLDHFGNLGMTFYICKSGLDHIDCKSSFLFLYIPHFQHPGLVVSKMSPSVPCSVIPTVDCVEPALAGNTIV